MLDDLTEHDAISISQKYKALIVYTSPGKHQAWILTDGSLDAVQRHTIQSDLIAKLNKGSLKRADPGASSGKQVGRAPGFLNRKEKYRDDPPQVHVVDEPWSGITTLAVDIESRPPSPATAARAFSGLGGSGKGGSESEREFRWVLARLGWGPLEGARYEKGARYHYPELDRARSISRETQERSGSKGVRGAHIEVSAPG